MDAYDDFLVFEPRSLDILVNTCLGFVSYNFMNRENMLLPFFEVLLEKVVAATRI